jgi:hypothetical protein
VFSEVGTEVLQNRRSTPRRVHQHSGYRASLPLPKLQGPAQQLGPGLWPRCNVTPRIIASPVLLFSGVILIEVWNRRGALTRVVLVLYDQAWSQSV